MEKDVLRIRGGKTLSGEVVVPGAKNAALKQIAATLLTEEPVTLENMPDITDVRRMLEIIRAMGANVEEDWENARIIIEAKNIDAARMPTDAVRALRASIVLLGPLLIRCGSVTMPYPGGDKIGARPLTAHIEALEQLGAHIETTSSELRVTVPDEGLHAGRVVLPEFSVTATENAMMAAAGIPEGETEILIAASEPHVQDLAKLLTEMGAHAELSGQNTYRIKGTGKLHGATHAVVGDVLDAFTFLAAGLVTRGEVRVKGIDPDELLLPLLKLAEMGADVLVEKDALVTQRLSGTLLATKIQALPYPGLPSDLQPLFALLATQADGTSLIQDPLYENRFRYLEELSRMGADASMLDPHRAVVKGPTQLTGIPITTFDIRAGAVLVLAALAADGETTIQDIHHIDRGYQNIDGRLRALGAEIERVTA